MGDRPLKYRKLIAILKRYGVHEDKSRGKGSERMLVGRVDNRIEKFPTKCHSENDEKPRAVVRAIRRRFRLTKEDGVSDAEFYS